jgi:hypothetical protein
MHVIYNECEFVQAPPEKIKCRLALSLRSPTTKEADASIQVKLASYQQHKLAKKPRKQQKQGMDILNRHYAHSIKEH